MRRFFGFLLTMALLGGGAFWLPYLQAEPVDNVYQAADLLRQDAENGGNGVAFREDNVDADEVYRALEAQYPYAFALHAVTRPNKTIELNAEVSRQARQEQAWEYAKVLTAGSISQTMTAEEKLRALHDTLIRQCEYDVDTAEEDAPDGSAPAFAADGALNLGKSFYSPVEPFQPDITLREADMLPFGGESITVLHTPGHTSGSCVYCLGNILFTGDTLMRFSIGRTDFPTGNLAEMRASLSRLAALEGEYLVYPGHGGPTTLQKERENNPYLGQSNYDDIY